jgi:FMN-dependent NADH-azoreductase
MTRVLYVTSSPRRAASYSNQVAARVIDEIRQLDPGLEVVARDLAGDPPPHIDDDFFAAIRSPDGPGTAAQRAWIARSDALVDELLGADILVIASAMINFGVPSTLKAWIDHIARAGRTFKYSEAGVQGLITGKRAILIVASGGFYSDARKAHDFNLPYLRSVLANLGLTDVESFAVEGTAFGPEAAERAAEEAARRIRERFAAAA